MVRIRSINGDPLSIMIKLDFNERRNKFKYLTW